MLSIISKIGSSQSLSFILFRNCEPLIKNSNLFYSDGAKEMREDEMISMHAFI